MGEHYKIAFSEVTGDFLLGENPGDYGFVEIRAQASSRGTGFTNWASISCP